MAQKFTVKAEIEIEITADGKQTAEKYYEEDIRVRIKKACDDGKPSSNNPYSIGARISNEQIKDDHCLSNGFEPLGN